MSPDPPWLAARSFFCDPSRDNTVGNGDGATCRRLASKDDDSALRPMASETATAACPSILHGRCVLHYINPVPRKRDVRG